MSTIKITLEHEVSLQRIQDLLVGAFEGGSNYWIDRINTESVPPVLEFKMEEMEDETVYNIPVNKGGALNIKVYDYEEPVQNLTLESISEGLKLMASKYPRHFKDFIESNEDADTSDVFLQCCVLKDVVFG